MTSIQSWPLLPLLLIGLINVLVCYWTAYWGLDCRIGFAALTVLAFAAGWVTPEKLWGAVLALLVPVMFLASQGRPWQLPIGLIVYPFLLIHFVLNIGPIVAAYALAISIGHWTRRRTAHVDLQSR
jgi:hypothetical protein